ncbi:MAG: hypothetical protein GXP42_07820 [Chloroflexi bacterium]|nr:hypothetical protein [Chloroflexota bacterium]
MRQSIGTFFLAFMLAIIVWVVAKQQEDPIEVRTIGDAPVEVRNLPDSLVMTQNTEPLPAVDVRLRAPRSVLDILTPNDVTAYVDLSEATAGRQEVPVQVDVRVSNVDVREVIPAALVIELERRITQPIRVDVNIPDDPPFGYAVGAPTVEPPLVQISGPESVVARVAQATVTVNVINARTDVESTETVTLRDANGFVVSGVEVSPRRVRVTVPIEQKQGFSEKSVLPRVEGRPARNYRITGVTTIPATVTLFGDPDALSEMPPFVETVPIDITGATDDVEERVPLVIPETVSVIGAQSVLVRIGIQPIEGSLTLTLRPVIQGLSPDLKVDSISPETIDVILLGPLPRLQSLTDESLRAVLDLSGMDVGSHEIAPIIVAPEGITVQTILPPTVQVTIVLSPTPTPTPTATSTPTPGPLESEGLTPTPTITPTSAL